MSKLDFKGLASELLARAPEFLAQILPGGRRDGSEWKCGNLRGDAGRSLSINMKTGVWKDFSEGVGGADLISLYAAIHGISQGDAAKHLGAERIHAHDGAPARPVPPPPTESEQTMAAAPDDQVLEDMTLALRDPRSAQEPSRYWPYQLPDGHVVGYVARYEKGNGRKEVKPWRWSSADGWWIQRGFPKPRILYNLPRLAHLPAAPVMVVEGEKAADAAAQLLPSWVVTTWPGGVEGVKHADWSVLAGRAVTLWPDHDLHKATEANAERSGVKPGQTLPYEFQPGRRAMEAAGTILAALGATVRIVEVGLSPDLADGWDAADALESKIELPNLVAFLRAHVKPFVPSVGAPADITDKPRAKERPPSPPPAVTVSDPATSVPFADEPSVPGATELPSPSELALVAGAPVDHDEPPPKHDVSKHAEPVYLLWERLGLDRSDKGPYPTEANAMRILGGAPTYTNRIWLDEFSQKLMILAEDTKPPRMMNRTDMYQCLIWMQTALALPKMPLSAVERAAVVIGAQNTRHPVREYLDKLTWDGVERLPTLLADGWGVQQNEYTAAVGRCWLVAMVARAYRPGCKHDHMIVFEGPQNIAKSSSLRTLCANPDWFMESNRNPIRNPDAFSQSLQGKWLVEIPEIDKIGGRHGSLEDLTGMITIQVDSYRMPYAPTFADYPRQTVLAGTTNRYTDWQPDDTGGRRYWPVRCGIISLEYLSAQRDQLFAEAVARFRRGEKWWDVPLDAAREEQEERRQHDPWESHLRMFITHVPRREVGEETIQWVTRLQPLTSMTTTQILNEALLMPASRWGRSEEMRIGKCLRSIGWERRRTRGASGEREYRYYPAGAGAGQQEEIF